MKINMCYNNKLLIKCTYSLLNDIRVCKTPFYKWYIKGYDKNYFKFIRF
jgi:hypothetical protein